MNTAVKQTKGLNTSLWVAQVLLAIMYIMAGGMKLFQPIEALSGMLPWVSSTPAGLVRFIGLSELAGGLGLLLPAILRIKPILTPIAAIGLVFVQVFAIIFHISRGEASIIGMNIILVAIAVFIAWGRMKKVPIQPKT